MDIDQKPAIGRKRGQRSWTDAQRAEQAATLHARQIWLKSTGPRTFQGKRISSRNSLKHGYFSYEKQLIRWYIRFAALRLKQIRTHLAYHTQKRENELRDKYGIPAPKTPDTMAFYPYFKVHPLYAKKKPRPKTPREPSNAQKIHDYFTSLGGDE